jgi:hypothetical protein
MDSPKACDAVSKTRLVIDVVLGATIHRSAEEKDAVVAVAGH